MMYKVLSIAFFSLIFSSDRVFAQAENYRYYLDYYWGNRDRNFAIKVTNKLINTTEKGRQYIDEYNDAAREYDNMQSDSRMGEYERLAGRLRAKEKQYKTAKTMAALAQTAYNLCTSNCQSKYQTYVNATKNVNRIVQEHQQLYDQTKSMYNSIQRYQEKLDAKRNTLNRLGEKIASYIKSQKI